MSKAEPPTLAKEVGYRPVFHRESARRPFLVSALALVLGQARAAVAQEPVTRMVEESFSLRLPGKWSRVRTVGDAVIFRPFSGSEQITVTVMETGKMRSKRERREMVRALLRHRQEVERRNMGRDAPVEAPVWRESETVASVHYLGLDPDAHHRFATFILCSSRGAWIFFHESDESSEVAFQQRTLAIMTAAQVRK